MRGRNATIPSKACETMFLLHWPMSVTELSLLASIVVWRRWTYIGEDSHTGDRWNDFFLGQKRHEEPQSLRDRLITLLGPPACLTIPILDQWITILAYVSLPLVNNKAPSPASKFSVPSNSKRKRKRECIGINDESTLTIIGLLNKQRKIRHHRHSITVVLRYRLSGSIIQGISIQYCST